VPTELTAEDKLAARRLNGLLDYVEALVKLDENPATRLAQHKLADGSHFILHQHELVGFPGIAFDISDPDGPTWLRIDRLQRVLQAPQNGPKFVESWVGQVSLTPEFSHNQDPLRTFRDLHAHASFGCVTVVAPRWIGSF
jgi:hypothetical protein